MDSKSDNIHCPICLEEIMNQIIIKLKVCDHRFCKNCFDGLLIHHRNKCPICNNEFIDYEEHEGNNIGYKSLTIEEFERISSNKKNLETYLNENYDCFTLDDTLKEARNYQILLSNLEKQIILNSRSKPSTKEKHIFYLAKDDIVNLLETIQLKNDFEMKHVVKTLSVIIQTIKDLQCRKYINDIYEIEEDNKEVFQVGESIKQYDISYEILPKKNGFKKKKKH